MASKALLIVLLVNFVSDYSYGQRDKKFFRKDYTYIDSTEGFYKIHTLHKSWFEAKRVCAQEGASLFYPENEDEAQDVISHWNDTQPFSWVYVGISDLVVKGVFETINGHPVADVYHNWGPGEPNDKHGSEDCVIMRRNGQLNDINCNDKNPFICKKSLLDLEWNQPCNIPNLDYIYNEEVGRCYKFHRNPMNWTDAYSVCSAEQSYLAVINTQAEADYLVRLTEIKTRDKVAGNYLSGAVHLGFHNRLNEGWQAVRGTTLDDTGYVCWGHNQPDGDGKEKCGSMFYNGLLNDVSCDTKCFFICEHEVDTLASQYDDRFDGQSDTKFFQKDYTYIDSTKSFYKIHTVHKSWFEAKQVCAEEGASLFYPENEDEAQAVISHWKVTQSFSQVYVGISDLAVRGVFETINGNHISEVYHNWASGEPNDANGVEHCVTLLKEGSLNDVNCNDKNPFLCKKTILSLECNLGEQRAKHFFRNDYTYIKPEESFYKIHTTPRAWTEAKRICSLEGATLWHPDNETEANAVISFWTTTQPHIGWVYVGLSDILAKGLFETVDGKSISEVYNNWRPGQPDGYGGKQDCVCIFKEGYLDDLACDYKYSFICKKRLQSLKWNDRCNIPDPGYTLNKDNGKCYKLHTTPLDWHESYTVCRLEQSHLAVITNQQEANYLANLTETTPRPSVKENYQKGIYHVGFHNKFKEGWQTVKETRMNVDADVWWGGYQPAEDRDQCGSMFYTGRLVDTDCNMKSFFICENESANSCTELAHAKSA